MTADAFASQQEIYELRSQVDRAYTRIDELIEDNKKLARKVAKLQKELELANWWTEFHRDMSRKRKGLLRDISDTLMKGRIK